MTFLTDRKTKCDNKILNNLKISNHTDSVVFKILTEKNIR